MKLSITTLIISTLAIIALSALTGQAMAQDLTAASALETETVDASASTPGDLSSQRIRGAAALNANCATNETYETTLDAEDVVDSLVEECTAELAVADPAAEIDEAEAAAEPTEDYPVKN